MVPSFCDCSRRATVGETSVYSAASRSRRLPGDIRHLRKIAHAAVHPAIDLLGAEGRLTERFQLGPQLRQRHGFDVFQGFLLNLQIKKPSVSRCPGSSVTIAPGAMPEPLWPRRVFRDEVRMRAQEVLRHSLVFPAQDRAGAVEQHAAGADIFRLLRKNGALQGGAAPPRARDSEYPAFSG